MVLNTSTVLVALQRIRIRWKARDATPQTATDQRLGTSTDRPMQLPLHCPPNYTVAKYCLLIIACRNSLCFPAASGIQASEGWSGFSSLIARFTHYLTRNTHPMDDRANDVWDHETTSQRWQLCLVKADIVWIVWIEWRLSVWCNGLQSSGRLPWLPLTPKRPFFVCFCVIVVRNEIRPTSWSVCTCK